MATAHAQYSFLEKFVVDALRQHGFDKLPTADQQAFLPQFVAEAERRLGIAVMPRLNSDAAMAEFNRLLQSEASVDDWYTFWKTRVPDFSELLQHTLESFVKELAGAFRK